MPLPPSGTCAGGTEANRKSVPREMTSLRPLLFFSFKEDTSICAAASPGRTQGWVVGDRAEKTRRGGEVGRSKSGAKGAWDKEISQKLVEIHEAPSPHPSETAGRGRVEDLTLQNRKLRDRGFGGQS